jgi:hypothetical protein
LRGAGLHLALGATQRLDGWNELDA